MCRLSSGALNLFTLLYYSKRSYYCSHNVITPIPSKYSLSICYHSCYNNLLLFENHSSLILTCHFVFGINFLIHFVNLKNIFTTNFNDIFYFRTTLIG